jgi:hypothetical protein
MKTNYIIKARVGRRLHSLLAAGALFLVAAQAPWAQAQPASPAGDWDFVMLGARDGLAHLTFSEEQPGFGGTFTGYELLVPKPTRTPQVLSGRTATGDAGRGDIDPPDPETPSGVHLFGFGEISGNWRYDTRGRVIGNFVETSDLICTTNTTFITNIVGGVIVIFATNEVICASNSHPVSFIGRPVQGARPRFTFTASSPIGRVIYRGLPLIVHTNLSGEWFGTKRQNFQTFTEFFSMQPSSLPGANPNIYDVNGFGPGYAYTPDSSIAMLSRQGKIGFVFVTDQTSGIIRATLGPFNSRRARARTVGWEQAGGTVLTKRIIFDVQKLAGPPLTN